MLRFRPATDALGPVDDLVAVGQLIDDVMRPGNFFVAPELRLTWVAARSETIAWEIFRGRLVDATQTRERKTFLSWHIIEENTEHPATEPTISVKLDIHERRIHVTRGLLCYAWEGHDAGGVIESREVVKWTRELVGSILLEDYADAANLRDELICLIWQAIVGTSRLPLTSVEAPLPAFSFGKLHYVYRSDTGDDSLTSLEALWTSANANVGQRERVKLVEFVFRAAPLERLLPLLVKLGVEGMAPPIWRAIFNGVSLSPYTPFVDRALTAITLGMEHEKQIDFCSDLLIQLGQHLTAYDLITFHHRGANYPDALLLDALLKRHLGHASFPEFFLGSDPKTRRRRRALRQGCLLRRHYEGLAVPDLPTSPGENARVLPSSHPRVPEEQLTQTVRRHRLLFQDDPLAVLVGKVGEGAINSPFRADMLAPFRAALEQSMRDLEHPDERAELGVGLFIDRPLGYAKAIGEPDLTPMLAHEAFSPSIARRRWRELKNLCAELGIPFDAAKLDPLFENGPWPTGLPHAEVRECPRPTAALCDVRKVADDFVIVRTLPIGLARMLDQLDLHLPCAVRLCVQGFAADKRPALVLYDETLQRRVEIEVDVSQGYRTRAGVEYPRAGLRIKS